VIWCDMIWYMIWYDIWYDMIWYDIWYDMIWYMIWHDIWYMILTYEIWWYMMWCDMIYDIWHDIFVNCNWVDTRWHLHTNNTQNNTMKQNTQNATYITISTHKHNNKNTWFTKLSGSIQNTQPYIYNDTKKNQKNMKECDKRNSHKSSKLHIF